MVPIAYQLIDLFATRLYNEYMYTSLAKLLFTSNCSHKSFSFSKKAKRNKSLSIVRPCLSINSFGKIPREIGHQLTPAFLELKRSF